MIVEFERLPQHARIWIYATPTRLNPDDQERVITLTADFLENWMAHGQALSAGCAFFYDHFLVIGVDESRQAASGCSIDASVRAIQQVETSTGFTFSDRTFVPFLENGVVQFISLKQIKKALAKGEWSGKTVTFNPSVSTKVELSDKWLVTAEKSWLRRYLSAAQLTS